MQEAGDCVLVVGATGGVGQVLTGKLLDVGTLQGTAYILPYTKSLTFTLCCAAQIQGQGPFP